MLKRPTVEVHSWRERITFKMDNIDLVTVVNITDINQTSLNCDANLPFLETIIFCCLQGISGFSSFTGNLLVLLAIYRTRQLQTVSNIFIASLATADFLVGLVICPLYIAMASLRVWIKDHVLITMEGFLYIQTLVATTLSLCAVSVDRYFAVTCPLRYHFVVTANRSKITILVVWIVSCLLASLIFFMANTDELTSLFFVTEVLTLGVPLLIISYCYVFIFKAVRAQQRRIYNFSVHTAAHHQQTREKAKHRKTAFTIAIIVGLFVLLFSPNFVFSVLYFTTKDLCQRNLYIRDWHWGILILFVASALNPWIYAILSREFRNPMKSILRKVLPCKLIEEPAKPAWLEQRAVGK